MFVCKNRGTTRLVFIVTFKEKANGRKRRAHITYLSLILFVSLLWSIDFMLQSFYFEKHLPSKCFKVHFDEKYIVLKDLKAKLLFS